MATIEKKWPVTYKVVLALTVVLVLLFTAFCVFVLMPMYEEYDMASADLSAERTKIATSEWDSSESGIANANKQYSLAIGSKKQPAAAAKSEKLLSDTTAHLEKLIADVKAASKNPSITHDGKKTYTDKYEEVKKYLQGLGIELVPAVYGMERISEGNYYNMTLKLLQTREIVDLLRRHRLSILRSEAEYTPEQESLFTDLREQSEIKKIHASQISTQTIKSYAIIPTDEPYLLEIPLKVTVQGTMRNMAAFAKDLSTEGRAYSLTSMEIQTVKPVQINARRAQLIPSQEDSRRVHLEEVMVTFVCTGFARPEAATAVDASGEPMKATKKARSVREDVTPRPMGI